LVNPERELNLIASDPEKMKQAVKDTAGNIIGYAYNPVAFV
jgi:hypothetical protein